MKKLTFLFSLMLISAMLLAACSDGGQGGAAGTVFPTGQAGEAQGTPGADGGAGAGQTQAPTTDPITGSGGTTAGTATAPAGGEGGAGGTDAGAPTATLVNGGAGGAGTDAGTPASPTATLVNGGAGGAGTAEGTPTAPAGGTGAIPQTGEAEQYALLSDILKMQVQGQDGNQVGNVGGVLIERAGSSGGSSSAAGGSSDTGTNPLQTTATPYGLVGGSDGATAATATPTAGTGGAGADSGSVTAGGERPRVSYVLVTVSGGTAASTNAGSDSTANTSGSSGGSSAGGNNAGGSSAGGNNAGANAQDDGNQVLIPWQAFSVSGLGMGAPGGPVAANQSQTATTEPGGSQPGGSQPGGSDNLALVLTIDETSLAAAPRFDASAFDGQVGDEVAQFWSGQIAGIPATGADSTAEGQQVLIRGQIGSISINGTQGENLGQVRDFVVDTQTGELAYAVLSGGSTFQGSTYVVPTTVMNWQAGQGAAGANAQGSAPGAIQMNVPSAVFSGAPSVGSVDEIETSAEWFADVDSYWMGGNK